MELQARRSGGVIIGKDVLQLMKDRYGIDCSLKSAYNHLKRAKLVWISARSRYPNSNPEEQEEFKKNREKVENTLPKTGPINGVEIWFQDEARFGQQGSLTRLWAIKGTRPRAVRQQQFKYTYLFGAVSPERGDAVGLLWSYANKDRMGIHLGYIFSQIPSGRHAVVVLDNSGWHTTKKWPNFQNLTLLALPAASPELNPCEQVWKYLRRTRLSNRTFKDEEELLDACSDAWNELTDEPAQVSSLTSRSWARL
ncbi:MAG: IS630 family transposase [Rhabdochlamydiaceae bacterium]